ncbi:hypothetical protein [Actinomyces sp. MRS3W]|uniref:hypothetical protein n=1 Tax=Actinomyces sp. MRS3W TaxID=2800796 RepID=UPI0028FD55C6|nr:hypothetical protein [Actinomyces sp. MRS3W]MDU0348204.1 hypothetical protein [Actinomyces sp. MRS3W]
MMGKFMRDSNIGSGEVLASVHGLSAGSSVRRVDAPGPMPRQIKTEAVAGYRGLEAVKTRLASNHVDLVPRLHGMSISVLCAVGTRSWWKIVEFMRRSDWRQASSFSRIECVAPSEEVQR